MIQIEQDKELLSLAKDDFKKCSDSIKFIEKEILLSLIPKDIADSKNAIIEIRPGTGGLEASLFALDIFHMYQKFCLKKGWKVDILKFEKTDLGGVKELSASIIGVGVYGFMKYETGVHRVQRIPETETNGRIHTSTMTVAVLPEAEDTLIFLKKIFELIHSEVKELVDST
jgi:peptide chain release factor 1